MTDGIRVANSENVETTPIKDLLFTSESISIKNVIAGSGSVSPTTHTNPNNGDTYLAATVTISHALGYAPTFLFYFRPGNFNLGKGAPWIADTNDPTLWSLHDNLSCSVASDTQNLTAYFVQGQAGIPFQYRYFIFVERSV